MKPMNRTFLLFVVTILLAFVAQAGPDGRPGDAEKKFEAQTLAQIDRREWQQAMITLAQYEQHLLSAYPPSTFEMDLFQDEASHLSFHSAFDGWKQIKAEEMGMPGWLRPMGFHTLLGLKGKSEDERLLVFAINLGQLEQRIGADDSGRTEFSDQKMLLFASMMAGNFGVVRSQEFKQIGDHRALMLEVATPTLGPSIFLANLQHGKQIYSFMLLSPKGNWRQNEQRLLDTLKTAGFKYRLPDETAIKSIRGKFSARQDPRSAVECVRQLAALGAYSAAAEEIVALRGALFQRLQPASVNGKVARMPAYGVEVLNPDERKWKLSAQSIGVMQMLLLEDKFSVKNEGIGVMAINTVMTYGPDAAKALEDEKEQREFLTAAGRGAALSVGAAIESEQFTTFKSALAYEATITTNFPGIKGRVIVALRRGHMLGVLMLADSNNFQERVKQYQQILDADTLRLEYAGIK